MKITLTKGTIHLPNGQQSEISTLELINTALDSGTKDGLSVADFRARGRVDVTLNKLAADATEVEFDEKDKETLKKAVEGVRWIARNGVIKTFMSELYADAPEESEEVETKDFKPMSALKPVSE